MQNLKCTFSTNKKSELRQRQILQAQSSQLFKVTKLNNLMYIMVWKSIDKHNIFITTVDPIRILCFVTASRTFGNNQQTAFN